MRAQAFPTSGWAYERLGPHRAGPRAYRVGLREAVGDFIGKLKNKSPAILKFAKLSINRAFDTVLSTGMESEIDFFAMCCGTEDQKEGAKAFLEKRHPVYIGK